MADLTTLLSKFLNDLYSGILGTTLPITAARVGDGTAAAPSLSFASETTKGLYSSGAGQIAVEISATQIVTWTSTLMTVNGNFSQIFKTTAYNNVTTAGWGIPAIYAAGRVTAQSAANASIATYTVGAADGSFEVSANMNVTASTSLATTLTVTYTDESNTARSMILPSAPLSGTFVAAGAITGTGPWHTPVMHIRAKAATAITVLTSAGTFTGVTYTAEGIIKQTA
jgi:hypothetical protein